MKLKPVRGLGSPAAIEHDGRCNQVLIDPAIWPKIPRKQQKFILEHELAHCKYNVFDETEADRIGFLNFTAKGGNPKDAGRAISENLILSDPLIQQRHRAMQNRIYRYQNGMAISNFIDPEPWLGGDYPYKPVYHDPAQGQRAGWTPSDWNTLIDSISGSVADVIVGRRSGGNYPITYASNAEPPQTPWPMIVLAIIAVIILVLFLKK